MKKHIDKAGYNTSKIHDIETTKFAQQGKFLLVKKIDCYYSKEEGIYGFFPSYGNNHYDEPIMESSFYKEFLKDYAEKIKNREITKGNVKIIHETIHIQKGDYIKKLMLYYDENTQKITALKVKTNNTTYSIGKSGDLNNKEITNIVRENYFIPGFKTTYIIDNGICYLSYIQAYYDNFDNLDKYYTIKTPSRFKIFLSKKVKTLSNIINMTSKFLLIVFILFFPFIYYYYSSQNIKGGEIKIPHWSYSLSESVKIHTDSNGFSHIKAENKNDAYFALGFVHAKERLWQMDFIRRTARGKLSEIFGSKTVQVDKIMRSLGLNEVSQKFANYLSHHSKHHNAFLSYTQGINHYANTFFLPPEYLIFQAHWTDWEVADSISITNLMTLTLTHDWNMEIWYKVLEESLGKEFAELVSSFRDLNFPFANETIVNDDELMNLNMHKTRKKSDELIRIEREQKLREAKRGKAEETQEKIKIEKENVNITSKEQWDSSKLQEDKLENLTNNISDETLIKEQALKMALEQLNKKDKLKDVNQDEIIVKDNDFIDKNDLKANEQESKDLFTESLKETVELSTEENNHFDQNSENDRNGELSPEKGKVKSNSEIKSDMEIIPPLHNQGASNSWVISGKHTITGSPILSNDPHLTNSMPALFFVAKIYLPEETLVGSTVPGLPYFVTGSNRQISWGFTTENSDTADICEEKIDDEFYIYDNKKYRIRTNKEVIYVKGSNTEVLDLKWTHNGPIIFETFPKELLVINLEFKHGTPLSIRFPFYFVDYRGPDFYFALNYAKTPSDFKNETEKYVGPNLNLIYASTSGEIGWLPIGFFPLKNYKNRFCRGYTSDDDILKYIKRIEMPNLINPQKGFIVTANNKLASFNYTYELHGFHNHIRAYRIREMIEERIKNFKKFTIEDNREMMSDLKDSLAEYMLPQILSIIERNHKNFKNLLFYKELKEWNFTMVKNSPIPTIWSTLELFIGKQLLTNKINDQKARGLVNMLHYWNFVSALIDKIHRGERVDLKQCAHLSGNINCEKYIVYIFTNLDKFLIETGLKDRNGRVVNWGEVKFNHYPHAPLDKIPIINKIFSRDVSTGGNRNTPKISRGPFNHDKGQFISIHSPRLKFISDMSEPTRPYIIIDGGNSGNILSKFYNNLMLKCENTELIHIDDVNFENIIVPNENTILLIK